MLIELPNPRINLRSALSFGTFSLWLRAISYAIKLSKPFRDRSNWILRDVTIEIMTDRPAGRKRDRRFPSESFPAFRLMAVLESDEIVAVSIESLIMDNGPVTAIIPSPNRRLMS